MRASLKNYRQAPRKVRLVADMVKGKQVSVALDELSVVSKKAAGPIAKLIRSAVANARQAGETASESMLVISSLAVNKGVSLVRYMPRARGRASLITRESSHVSVMLTRAPEPKPRVHATSDHAKETAPTSSEENGRGASKKRAVRSASKNATANTS